MKRLYKPNSGTPYRHNVRPESAGWKYLSFGVLRLEHGQSVTEATGGEEIAIVPITGDATVSCQGQTYTVGRENVFRELTDIVYLPPGVDYRISAEGPLEVAIGGAPASGKLPPRLIRREDMPSFVRGGANVSRGVSILLDSDDFTERLTVYEIRPPSGNWSSFPPHRHDARENSSYHEESYYYRLTPEDGFVLQRIYTRDTDLDVAIVVSDGDLVLVHEGYHPVVNAPGTNAYYLNFIAGDVRKMRPVNDPHYEWVNGRWEGFPLNIPVTP
jgi:5-deoxy-glucuronate isomerase